MTEAPPAFYRGALCLCCSRGRPAPARDTPRRRPERARCPGRYLLRILATMTLTQGAEGFRQTDRPCFVVALRGEGGGEAGAGAGPGPGRGRALT